MGVGCFVQGGGRWCLAERVAILFGMKNVGWKNWKSASMFRKDSQLIVG